MLCIIDPEAVSRETGILEDLARSGIEHRTPQPAHGWNYVLDHVWLTMEIDAYLAGRRLQNLVVLDVGCGRSLYHDFLESRLGIDILGIDRPSGHGHVGEVTNIDYYEDFLRLEAFNDDSVDIIIWLSSIEHNELDVLRELYQKSTRLLKPGGLFLATIPVSERTYWFTESQQTNLSPFDAQWLFDEEQIIGDFVSIKRKYRRNVLRLADKYLSRYGGFDEHAPDFITAGVRQLKTNATLAPGLATMLSLRPAKRQMNVLFYIEPMLTLDKPFLYTPWWHFANRIITALEKNPTRDYSCRVITSEPVATQIPGAFSRERSEVATIPQEILLRRFNFDYYRASLAWYKGTYTQDQLEYAARVITDTLGAWAPDLVITMSPAPHIQEAFPNALILHHEYGITSRPPFPESFYLDPEGFYKDSYLVKNLSKIRNAPIDSSDRESLERYRKFFVELIEARNPFSDLLASIRKRFEHTVLVPLQAARTYWFDGNCEFTSQFQFAQYVLASMPESVGALFSPHPDYAALTPDVISYLRSKYPNFLYFQEFETVQSASQYLIGHTDGVISVSSMVGLQAMIWRKKTIAIGTGQVRLAADAEDLAGIHDLLKSAPVDRDNILLWLLTRYCIPGKYMDDPGWLAAFIDRALGLHERGAGFDALYEQIDDTDAIISSLLDGANRDIPIRNRASIREPGTAPTSSSQERANKNSGSPRMEYTGERYVPELQTAETSYEHWHRYAYASQFVRGKVVLDVACGEGYGSDLLARAARKVVGCDISPVVIQHAASKYLRGNLEFRIGSASAIPIEGSALFDVAVSFESIEHLDTPYQRQFLNEIRRLLKPGGLFIVSTPNKLTYSDIPGYRNQFHSKEFYVNEFRDFLLEYFPEVSLLGQRIYAGSYIWPVEPSHSKYSEFSLGFTGEQFLPMDAQKEILYVIAFCSDRAIAKPGKSFAPDLTHRMFGVRDQEIIALGNQSREKEQRIQELSAQLAEKEQAAKAISAQLAEREQRVQGLSAQLAEKEQAAKAFLAQMAEREATLQGLNSKLFEIYGSTSWSVVKLIWRTRLFLAPHGSRRERLGQTLFRPARIGRHERMPRLVQPAASLTLGRREIEQPRLQMPQYSSSLANQIAESGLFDTDWYLARYPDVRDAGIEPLQHYIEVGAAEGRYPNPLFDTSIYVIGHNGTVSAETALIHFHRSGRAVAPGAYRSPEVLISIQRAYQASCETLCTQDLWAGQRRFAVYLQCGAGSVHKDWLKLRARPWDLIINHYDGTYAGTIACDLEFRQTGSQPGTKFTSFLAVLSALPHLAGHYDYVMLLDDDIVIQEEGITQLFTSATELSIDLAQASLSSNSDCAHPVVRNPGNGGIRYLNAVEIMMPVLSQRVLRLGVHLFNLTVSGWGLDMVLGKIAANRLNGRAAVIDSVVAEHTKPIDVGEGSFYRMLHRANIFPEIELSHLQRLYHVGRDIHEVGLI